MENSNYVPEIYISENGNWFINGVDTGTHAQGKSGKDGVTPHISEGGYWCIGVKALGEQGPKGDKGDQGATGDKGTRGPAGSEGPGTDRGNGLTWIDGTAGASGGNRSAGTNRSNGAKGIDRTRRESKGQQVQQEREALRDHKVNRDLSG